MPFWGDLRSHQDQQLFLATRDGLGPSRKMQDQSNFYSLWSSIPGFHLTRMPPCLRHHAAEGSGYSRPYRTGTAYGSCYYITHRSSISHRHWCYCRRRRANRDVLLERILHPSLQKWLQIDDGIMDLLGRIRGAQLGHHIAHERIDPLGIQRPDLSPLPEREQVVGCDGIRIPSRRCPSTLIWWRRQFGNRSAHDVPFGFTGMRVKGRGRQVSLWGRCRHGVSLVEMIDVANSDADKRKRIKPYSTT
jgi:hypothetical protein